MLSVLEASDALKRRNGYSEKGTSTCASRKSPPLVSSLFVWFAKIVHSSILDPAFNIKTQRATNLHYRFRASSASRPGSSIYSSHPAERAAVSTSTHCSAPQSCPRLSTAQPADTVHNSALTALILWSPFLHGNNVCRTSLTRPFAATVSREKHL
jgi:hypothetical protein